jgi:hypothetical protein
LFDLITRIASRIYQKIFYLDQWFLLVDCKGDESISFGNFRKIIPPEDRFWADPILIKAGSSYYIFIEEYIYERKKGHISCLIMDQEGNIKDPIRVLDKEYHLSYPFVFEWNGNYYMVPESVENKSISLYQSIDFPYEWKFKTNLMENILAVDTTLFHYQEKWWLFTGLHTKGDFLPFVDLYLFYSKDLFSYDWKSHPQNPIVSDAKTARPAGRIYIEDGKLIRPSQNCSKSYGYGINLNEILILSETEYREETIDSVRPEWDKKVAATHTFAHDSQFTVIDALMRRRKFSKNFKRVNST